MNVENIEFEAGYIVITFDSGARLRHPISAILRAEDIPNISASKITSGELGAARIPNISASKITSGTFGSSRIADAAITVSKLASPDVAYIGVYGRSEYGRAVYGTA